MNPQQTNYLKERINGIVNDKVAKLRVTYPDDRMTDEEILTALKENRFYLKDGVTPNQWGRNDIRDFIVFDETDNSEIRRKCEKEIRAESRLLMDQVMLEGKGVADALARFAEKEF